MPLCLMKCSYASAMADKLQPVMLQTDFNVQVISWTCLKEVKLFLDGCWSAFPGP